MSKKILIVEDNSVQSLMLKHMLEEDGRKVIGIVDRGEEAIVKTLELQPDLVVMDIFLNGDMTGIEAMRVIRDRGNDVPVLYVSGNSDPYYARKAEKTPFSRFLFKPIKQNDLAKAVKILLGKAQHSSSPVSWMWPFSLFF